MKIRVWVNDGPLRSVLVSWGADGPAIGWWSLGGSVERKASFMAEQAGYDGDKIVQVIGQCAGQTGHQDATWMRSAIAERSPLVLPIPNAPAPGSLREIGLGEDAEPLLAVADAARRRISERGEETAASGHGARVVAVRPESCRGPGWANRVVWVYERQADGPITERGLQPDEWQAMPGLGDLFAVGEACQDAMIGAVSKSDIGGPNSEASNPDVSYADGWAACREITVDMLRHNGFDDAAAQVCGMIEERWSPNNGPAPESQAQPTWTLHQLYSVARTRSETSEERYGQALFNTLVQVRPDIAERLRGSDADPFHANGGDGRADRAIAVIESMWGERPC